MLDTDLRQKGQSIVLVAAAMVVLVLFVALAVDLSDAYYHRRTAQNAADGGALAGASQMATSINKLQNKDDALIDKAINRFAEMNGIEDTGGAAFDADNENVEGWYVNSMGSRLPLEPKIGAGKVPDGAAGVEVITHIVAPTYFGGIFGLRGLPITARAVSLLKEACGDDCVVPITTDIAMFELLDDPTGSCFNIWRENQNEIPTPGLYGWVNWTWQEEMCALDTDRECPEVDQGTNACDSTVLGENLDPFSCGSGYIEVGDWMSGAAGVINADDVRCWLLWYLGSHNEYCEPVDPWVPHGFVIPVYDYTTIRDYDVDIPCLRMKDPYDPNTGGLHYHVAGFARMELMGFQLSQGTSGSVSAGVAPTDCVTLGTMPNDGNRITAKFVEWVDNEDLGTECTNPMSTIYSAPKLFE